MAWMEVDCEQSLLFPPVIVLRRNERGSVGRVENGTPTFPRSVSALGTITGGKRRDCSQSRMEVDY